VDAIEDKSRPEESGKKGTGSVEGNDATVENEKSQTTCMKENSSSLENKGRRGERKSTGGRDGKIDTAFFGRDTVYGKKKVFAKDGCLKFKEIHSRHRWPGKGKG